MILEGEHGRRSHYVSGCRHRDCVKANRDYASSRKRYGWTAGRVDAKPVRAHVDWLRINGMGIREIVRTSGVARSTVMGLYRSKRTGRPAEFVYRNVAEALLAVGTADPAPGAPVDGTGTARRLQALVCLGWSLEALSHRLGWTRSNIQSLIQPTPVRRYTAEKVKALYDDLWDKMPPQSDRWQRASVTRARNLAHRNGWVSPLAWDDEDIDDPYARPFVDAEAEPS